MKKARADGVAGHGPSDGVVRSEALRHFCEVVCEMGGDPELMAAIITATTLISFITMPIAIGIALALN